jgi:hypothetical protein
MYPFVLSPFCLTFKRFGKLFNIAVNKIITIFNFKNSTMATLSCLLNILKIEILSNISIVMIPLIRMHKNNILTPLENNFGHYLNVLF